MQVFLDFNSKKMQNQIRKKCKKQCYIVVHLVVSLRYREDTCTRYEIFKQA